MKNCRRIPPPLLVRRLHLKCPVRLSIQIPECLPDLLVIYTVSEEKTVTANNIVSIVDCHKSKQSKNIIGSYTKDICKIAMEIKGYDNGIPYHLSIGVNAVTKTIATIVLLTPPF